jgi:nucleotide-binding universal stress UspA family protein
MDKNLRDILVPVDFKEPSVKALKYAINVAKRVNGRIHLLHVLEMGGFIADLFLSVDEVVKITDKAKDSLQKLADDYISATGLEVSTRIERGRPHEKILEVIHEIHPRLVIMGENHQGTDARQILGVTAEHVTLKSEVPVITTKGDYDDPGNLMIVPLDLTKKTSRQITSAILYARHYNLKIHLVSALIGGINARESRILNKLRKAKETIESNRIECEIKLFPRSDMPPYRRVLQYAEQNGASVILVMTHQEGYTYDNYIGAFAHHIINESGIPVLSLTSTASAFDYEEVLRDFLDPLSILGRNHVKPARGPGFNLRKSRPEKE